jgi:hypothetical protein
MFRRFRISCPVYRSRRPLAWRPATTTRRFAATTTGWFTATTTGRFAAAAIRWSATTATGRFATTATGRFAAAAIGWLTTIRRRWWAVGWRRWWTVGRRRWWVARAITSRVIALITPAVGVTPMSPWTDTQENAVIEITRSVKTIGGAGVRCIGVVAISANGRRAADSNGNLGSSRR